MRLSYFLWNGGSALRNFYAKPDAEGAIDEITVEAVLKQEREGQEIRGSFMMALVKPLTA